MAKSAEELLQMKGQIEKADRKKSELQGQLKELMSRLKKEFGCSSVKEGDKKLEKLKDDLEKKQSRLDKGVESLRLKMEEENEER